MVKSILILEGIQGWQPEAVVTYLGVITSLLAQGYNPEDAALLSVYIHSKAGDMAADKYGQVSLIASDIIEFLPDAFRQFEDVVN